jgi:hypothetical protein
LVNIPPASQDSAAFEAVRPGMVASHVVTLAPSSSILINEMTFLHPVVCPGITTHPESSACQAHGEHAITALMQDLWWRFSSAI